MTKSLTSHSSESVLIFPSFLKGIFLESKILQHLEKYGATFSWPLYFLISNRLSFWLFPLKKGAVFLWLLSQLFVFSFQRVHYHVSRNDFFGEACFLSLQVCLMPNTRNFQPLFLWVLCQLRSSGLAFWDSSDTNIVTLFFIVPEIPESLFTFFSLCFLSFVQIGWFLLFYLLVPQFFFSVLSIWLLNPSTDFFFFFLVIVYFSSNIYLWFFI